ncbi:hypothetical protein BJV82DRAFT_604821 [Fennellomyces sp. T-0311]|nr:hypothetical protein BJV82DRAFT_604821 [Fennellomyces sp. T-0311]
MMCTYLDASICGFPAVANDKSRYWCMRGIDHFGSLSLTRQRSQSIDVGESIESFPRLSNVAKALSSIASQKPILSTTRSIKATLTESPSIFETAVASMVPFDGVRVRKIAYAHCIRSIQNSSLVCLFTLCITWISFVASVVRNRFSFLTLRASVLLLLSSMSSLSGTMRGH